MVDAGLVLSKQKGSALAPLRPNSPEDSQTHVPPVSWLFCQLLCAGENVAKRCIPETMSALTEIMYAIAKKVARPARNSVKNLEPFLSCR